MGQGEVLDFLENRQYQLWSREELSQKIGVSKAAMTSSLSKLVKQGLVEYRRAWIKERNSFVFFYWYIGDDV